MHLCMFFPFEALMNMEACCASLGRGLEGRNVLKKVQSPERLPLPLIQTGPASPSPIQAKSPPGPSMARSTRDFDFLRSVSRAIMGVAERRPQRHNTIPGKGTDGTRASCKKL